jgi:hypothetical protein
LIVIAIFFLLQFAAPTEAYLGTEMLLDWYIQRGADSLIEKEKRGELSREYGFVWSEINLALKMGRTSRDIIISSTDSLLANSNTLVSPASANPKIDKNTPSLAAIRELLRIQRVSNYITITDRYDYPLAEIKTTHTRQKLKEFSPVLINAIISAEDQNFRTRKAAYEYRSFIRATFKAAVNTIKNLKISKPKGTSTIHQQVAKFLLARFDERGRVYAERSIDRKVKELKLAQALKMTYPDDDILEVYLNHCVDAGHGMTGFHDISIGLFNKKPSQLDICQSLYLARLVKWNRNIPAKIMAQIKTDMPRIATLMGWDVKKQDSIITALPMLKFLKPSRIASTHDPLIDLANEYWLKVCRNNGMADDEIKEMDFTQPNTMIRRKGSLKIQLNIDLRLQKLLETQVNSRGFGGDTLIFTDVRIGSFGEDLFLKKVPKDTLRYLTILPADTTFSEPRSSYFVSMNSGDTLISNIRYKRKGEYRYRRSVYLYKRDKTKVAGQYFSYAMMNSRSGELLAYYSRDGIGSRLGSLLKNKTPNGSCLAKPIIYALNYDWGRIKSSDRLTDSVEIRPPLAWARNFLSAGERNIGMVYLNTTAPGGYPVSNYGKNFAGEDFVYNHLTESNNIISVEMIYRLNSEKTSPELVNLFNQIGDTLYLQDNPEPKVYTGAQLYSRIAGIVGAKSDTIATANGRIPFPADYYAVALGTLEMSLYQQMHFFNVLYNNEIIVNPEERTSLVIRSVSVSGIALEMHDKVEKKNLFSSIDNIRPVQLALHQRLVSNAADGLSKYDIALDSTFTDSGTPLEPLSNFAKSGTSDDIIRPYNKDNLTGARTNYCLWNAVLRLNLPASQIENIAENETIDITLSCVGEGNEKNTGSRDGKSLHKYLSTELLRRYGTTTDSGYYGFYKKFLEESNAIIYF